MTTAASLTILDPSRKRYTTHYEHWKRCTLCHIGSLAIKHVFASGQVPCDVLFIGEAPGKNENASGFPFVGRAGKLLHVWISRAVLAVGKPITYAITNTVLCRPCDSRAGKNRPPTQGEMLNCQSRLIEFVREIAKPSVIVALGKPARSSLEHFEDIRQTAIKHPSWVLHNGGEGTTQDLQESQLLTDFLQRELG